MEETLTNCLVRVKEDLSQLKKVREYLETNAETEERCSVTWRTIEAFSSILSVCSSQNTPETNALDTLLDSFYYLARNNTDNNVWEDFGFELGIICVKILSAIERTEIFEILFCKLLSIISIICEHNSNIWKATARQILNVLINKKFSVSNFEAILKICICILRNIESFILNDFSLQNLHLLKTLSLLIQKVGDFEIQSDIMELIFLHLSNDTKLMSDFFAPAERKLFQSLQFTDFEGDCRLYLNAVNKSKRRFDRKVYSICCHVLYLGGCFVEPPVGRSSTWVDANKDTQRVSIKCGDNESDGNRVICVRFSEILHVQLENDKTEGNRCLTIQTKSLLGLHKDVKNDDICLVTENVEGVYEFIHFLEAAIDERKKKKFGRKISKTIDSLFIDRNSPRKIVQDNAITSSERPGTDQILPDVFSLFERAKKPTVNPDMQFKSLQPSNITNSDKKTPPHRISQERKILSQELSPNSFVESLNKHIGLNSPELPRTYEDSIETIEFLQKSTGTPGKTHKLFRSPDKMFNILERDESKPFNFLFGENKENNPRNEETQKQKIRTYSRKPRTVQTTSDPSNTRVLRDRKNLETKLSYSQSQDCFQKSSKLLKKRKPSMPKLKRSTSDSRKTAKKRKNYDKEYKNKKFLKNGNEEKKECENQIVLKTKKMHKKEKIQDKSGREQNERGMIQLPEANELQLKIEERQKSKGQQNNNEKEKTSNAKKEILGKEVEPDQEQEEKKLETEPFRNQSENETKKRISKPKKEMKPSLLDPNGYAYQRWCKPTTSERSNFWLKKLDAIRQPKTSSDVFDFSDESDSILGKNQKKKRKVIHSKRKHWTKRETKQTSLREVKEIIKKISPVSEKSSAIHRKCIQKKEQSPVLLSGMKSFTRSPESFKEDLRNNLHSDYPYERTPSPESFHEDSAGDDSEFESVVSGEKEELPRHTEKRERSYEESSKSCLKKKSKITLPKSLLSSFRLRLQKAEEKDRRYTEEIIQTVNKATCQLFNHLQRKDGERVLSYLNAIEAVSTAFETEIDDLSLRVKRIQRATLYFKTGCSVSCLVDSLNDHFSTVRESLKNLKEKKDSLKTVSKISDRLESLIKTEIEKSISNEWVLKRNKLARCASIIGTDFKKYG